MSKQTLGGLLVIIMIIAGIGFWISQKPEPAKESMPVDPLGRLFSDIQQAASLDQPLVDAEVAWNVEVDDETRAMTFAGQQLRFSSADSTIEQTITNVLNTQDFVIDKLNVAAGTVGSLAGFQKDDYVCTLAIQKELDGQGLPVENGQTQYTLACAQANFAIEPVVSTEEAVQQLFADKYQTKKSAVAVLVEQEGVNHVRGSVRILDAAAHDPNAASGQGTGGIFLAAKVDGEWALVFDGNGAISCELVEGYGFPSEMVQDCSDDKEMKVAVGQEFIIALDSNPSTGYGWEVVIDNDLVSLVGKEYEAHGAEMVGAGGQEIFTFQAQAVGQAQLNFSYRRPWESQQPIKMQTYHLTIVEE